MDTKILDNLFTQYEALQATLRPLLQEQDNIKDQIKAALKATKLDSYTGGRVTATHYEMTRTMYPAKKLEEVVPEDLLKQVRVVTQTGGVRLTIAKEEGK